MGNLQRRIERVEQKCGIGRDDGPTVEIQMGGTTLRMPQRQLTGLLRWLQGRNEAPGGAQHELIDATR